MTPQEQLEDDIKTLEKALKLLSPGDMLDEVLDDKKEALEALKKPQFRDGTLGSSRNSYDGTDIMTYKEAKRRKREYNWEPLPIETKLRDLAPDGSVSWKYLSKNSIGFINGGQAWEVDGVGSLLRVPAPYREDWEGIGGTL